MHIRQTWAAGGACVLGSTLVVWAAACGGDDDRSPLDATTRPDVGDDSRDGEARDGAADAGERCEDEPADEICNGRDDDCDGAADEDFVLRCSTRQDGTVDAELTGEGFGDGVARNLLLGDDRGLALPALPERSEHLWVASSADNFVSKIRIADGVEVGRFLVGDNPSRTAVDGNGDAWVAMRGSVGDTGDPGEPLEGVVKIDGSCTPTLQPPLVTRECILLDLPEVGNLLRGVAIDARGDVWIGAHATGELVQLDGVTGEELRRIRLDPLARPYGLAMDEEGYVWVAAVLGDVHVVRIDPIDGAAVLGLDYDALGRITPYGIAADGAGGVWFGSNGSDVFRVDAATGEVSHRHTVGTTTRGVAFDDRGRVWAADSARDAVIAADAATGAVLFEVPVGAGPVGVAVDHDGSVWAANQFGDSVTKVDPTTGRAIATYPVGRNPYTYSDMTGSAFRVLRTLRGTFVGRYSVGARGARWTSVRYDGSVARGTEARFRMRAGDDDDALERAELVEVDLSSGEATLDLTGAFLEVEVVLATTDREVPPPYVERLRFTVELP